LKHFFQEDSTPEAFQYVLNAPNVILTPHVAGWTFESHERLAQVIVDKIKANYLGKPGLDIAEKRVSGIGGFFKAENSKELMAWYGRHLGLK
jgi:D-3-phosphoglycerate dehydrogenase